MNDTEKPPGASRETDEPQMPHFYGLSLFEYDVMALAVPGIVFMLLSYMLCSLLGFPMSKWTEWLTVSADWLREVVGATIMIVIAYLVGLSTDSLAGSEIVDWFARLIWKREDPGLDWDDVRLNVMRTRMPRNEYINVYRAGIQAKCLANLGVLCVSLGIAVALSRILRTFNGAPVACISCLVLGGVLLAASYFRARRRVWGVHLAYRLGRSGGTAPRVPAMRRFGRLSLVIRCVGLMAIVCFIASVIAFV